MRYPHFKGVLLEEFLIKVVFKNEDGLSSPSGGVSPNDIGIYNMYEYYDICAKIVFLFLF